MSYILDALKKAEAERNLGEIPGIHAQPLHLAADAPERTWRHDPWRWLALVCMALLLGLAAWKWWPTHSEPDHTVATPAPHSEPAAPPPAVQPAQAPAPTPAAVAENVPVHEAPAAKPARKVEKRTRHSDAAAEPRTPHPKPVEETPVAERDLPFNVQREIPSVTIGGYIYSARPADRSVLINQRLLREGDQISPSFTLVGIRPDGIVLDYRGQRFIKPY